MILKKPNFWQNRNFISFLLYPLSTITVIINFLKKLNVKNYFKIKTICVGNLNAGGTGKTSLAIELYKLLSIKYKTVFIKKKYSNQKDEYNLLKSRGKTINVRNRINALKIAEKKFDLAILDDGLQQKNVEYDLKIVCINSYEGFGNNFLIPAGPLRENLCELKNYDIAFLNGFKKNIKLKKKIKKINSNLKIFDAIYEPINLKKFNLKKKFLIFCGIGNPHEFENTLKKFNFKIKEKFIFPDHYSMSDKKINNLKILANKNKLSIITTEKDFLRLTKKQQKDINFLKVKLKIKNIDKLKKHLNKI
ncbi:tetraacyldisaccharide 4'-kinase [Candidatus Pelagibacter sp.]|nr:tetraacyldisaccharide 4'-kinase [Candidatus Pelagibacter sp.]